MTDYLKDFLRSEETANTSRDAARAQYRHVMANRERLCQAFIAETGLHPTNCVMIEQQMGDGRVKVWFEKNNAKGKTMSNDDGAMAELPKYKCHKIVHALKISEVQDPTGPNEESDGSRLLKHAEGHLAPIRVDAEYMRKHSPEAGGYYVLYGDGYKSYSPAKAFEDGYTRL